MNLRGDAILASTYDKEQNHLRVLHPETLASLGTITVSFRENVHIDEYRIYKVVKLPQNLGFLFFGCCFNNQGDLDDNIGSIFVIWVGADLGIGSPPNLDALKQAGKVKYFYDFEESYWSDDQPPVYKCEMLEAPGAQGEVVCAFTSSQMDEAKYLHIKNGTFHAVYHYFSGFNLRGKRDMNHTGNDCLTAFLGLQLLHYKVPGLHGGVIDEDNGYKYADDEAERYEYPPVILSVATGGKLEAGFVLNEPWKEIPMLADIIPINV